MSNAVTWYFFATLLASLPAYAALRRSRTGSRPEQALEAGLVAIAWPLTLPALFFGFVSRQGRVSTSR